MLFTWDTKDLCVVFPWWHVRGPWSLFFTLLGVLALGMSYELLRHLARKYDESTVGVIRIGTPDSEERPRSPNNTAKYVPLPCGCKVDGVDLRDGDILFGRGFMGCRCFIHIF